MSALVFLVGAIIVTIIIFIIVFYISRGTAFPPVAPCIGNESRSQLPLIPAGGVYLTRILLGTEEQAISFTVIPDTGSNLLVVSGPQCQNCDPIFGVWDPRLGEPVSTFPQEIRYAGGQVTRYIPWKAKLMNYDGGKEIIFGVATYSNTPEGRPLNVLGLQGEGNGFLDYICGQKTILFDYPRQQLYIGNVDDLIPPNAKPISLFAPQFGIPFTLGRITSITINGTQLSPSVTPRFAIFDTGTTRTIVSTDLAQQLQGKNNINITFEAPQSRTSTISFTIPNGSIESDQLPISSAMLIGNQWLRQYAVAFKHDPDEIIFY